MDLIGQSNSLKKLLPFLNNDFIILEGIGQHMRRNGYITHLFIRFKIGQNNSKEHIFPGCQSGGKGKFDKLLFCKCILCVLFINLKFDLSEILHAYIRVLFSVPFIKLMEQRKSSSDFSASSRLIIYNFAGIEWSISKSIGLVIYLQ